MLFKSTHQSTNYFTMSTILRYPRSVRERHNYTIDIVFKICHDSKVLNNYFEMTCKWVVSRTKKAGRYMYFIKSGYCTMYLSGARASGKSFLESQRKKKVWPALNYCARKKIQMRDKSRIFHTDGLRILKNICHDNLVVSCFFP